MVYLKTEHREFYNSGSFKKLLTFIPKDIIETLVKKYNADKWVKTLFTYKLLNLYILVNILKPKYITLRGIIALSSNILFKYFTGIKTISRSGLSDANSRMPSELFHELLMILMEFASKPLRKIKEECEKIKIFDTTFISLSLKLFPWVLDKGSNTGIKLGLRIDKGLPIPDKLVIDENSQSNDNNFFEKLIDLTIKGITYLFDRGFQRIETLDKIHDSKNYFITRLFPSCKYEVKKNLKVEKSKDSLIKIVKDQIILLGKGDTQAKNLFRLITMINEQGDKLLFLTNRFDIDAFTVCALYKQRWQIEIFFRWLKQYLKVNKFISYSENGAKIQIYMALITHILIILYQRANKSTSDLSLLETMRIMESQIFNSFAFFILFLGIMIGLGQDIKSSLCSFT